MFEFSVPIVTLGGLQLFHIDKEEQLSASWQDIYKTDHPIATTPGTCSAVSHDWFVGVGE